MLGIVQTDVGVLVEEEAGEAPGPQVKLSGSGIGGCILPTMSSFDGLAAACPPAPAFAGWHTSQAVSWLHSRWQFMHCR